MPSPYPARRRPRAPKPDCRRALELLAGCGRGLQWARPTRPWLHHQAAGRARPRRPRQRYAPAYAHRGRRVGGRDVEDNGRGAAGIGTSRMTRGHKW